MQTCRILLLIKIIRLQSDTQGKNFTINLDIIDVVGGWLMVVCAKEIKHKLKLCTLPKMDHTVRSVFSLVKCTGRSKGINAYVIDMYRTYKTQYLQGVPKKMGISVRGSFWGVKWPQIKKSKKTDPP